MDSSKYNLKSPAVKRLMMEAKELREATEMYYAQPTEENIFDWHFTLRGAEGTAFEGGIYHGRIIFPPEYPYKPPHIVLLTPNGRFETDKQVCLSVSAFHPEYWRPSWSVRTVLLALISFMPSKGEGAYGALDLSDKERRHLAKLSPSYYCKVCQRHNSAILPAYTGHFTAVTTSDENDLISNAAVVRPSQPANNTAWPDTAARTESQSQQAAVDTEGEAVRESETRGSAEGMYPQSGAEEWLGGGDASEHHTSPMSESLARRRNLSAGNTDADWANSIMSSRMSAPLSREAQDLIPRRELSLGEASLTVAIWVLGGYVLYMFAKLVLPYVL